MATENELIQWLEKLHLRLPEEINAEIQRNFRLMKDIDDRCESVMLEIENKGDNFLKIAGEATADTKRQHTLKMEELYDKAKSLADDKVEIAEQTQAMIERHINRLNEKLAEHEKQTTNGSDGVDQASSPTPNAISKAGRKRKRSKKSSIAEGESEPTYCYCQKKWIGEMIACDYPGCTIEWYHNACVGLKSIPEGEWYCPECLPAFKRDQLKKEISKDLLAS